MQWTWSVFQQFRVDGAIIALLLISLDAHALEVIDDNDESIHLPQPAQRIVSLAPHITELLFEAGAGNQIVGVTEYSDYPPRATRIKGIGNYDNVDIEAILRLQPELIIAWQSGNRSAQIDTLRQLGIPVFASEPRTLEDIGHTLRRFGQLAGTEQQARAAADAFEQQLARLRKQYQGAAPIRSFYQLWHGPLITINGEHIISDAMRLCGMNNIFSELPSLAPQVSYEAVVFKDPQLIVASGADDERPAWLDDWQQWPELSAVRAGNLFAINPDIIQRHTPRIIQGINQLCKQAERARLNLRQLKPE